jgi:mono/diheme cytochrome c family protein
VKRFLTVIALIAGFGALGYLVLNRTDRAAGAAAALAGAPDSAGIVARGEYLTTAADCSACHTVPGSGRSFAGGVAFKLPIGTIYSTNITPDPASGIGGWSDEEFLRAVRNGVGRHGEHLYPAFPYTSYTELSRDDVLAIKAYLMSLPPIAQPNRINDLGFPFNQRWAIGFWNALFFKNQRFAADPSKPPDWNSGAYLATALGHCAECHTPRNFAFGLEHGKDLEGAEIQGWRAYNITSDPRHGIGGWSDGELSEYLRTGFTPGHASAAGPMGEAVSHSLQHLNSADIASLVSYLRTVPAREGAHPIVVDRNPAPVLASSDIAPGAGEAPAHEQGLMLFEGACASCHQWTGMGQLSRYAALLGTRSVNDAGGANVTQTILNGVNMRIGDREVFMPAFGAYSNAEVAALANYVIAHFGGKKGEVTPDQVAARRAL